MDEVYAPPRDGSSYFIDGRGGREKLMRFSSVILDDHSAAIAIALTTHGKAFLPSAARARQSPICFVI